MPVQTTYFTEHAEFYPGQVLDMQLANTISKLNKSGANIPYGYGVISDGDGSAQIPGGAFSANQIIGLAVRDLDRAYADGEVFGAKDGMSFTVMTSGTMGIISASTAVKDDPVFLAQDGTIQNTNAGGAIQISGAKYTSSVASAGGKGKISLVIGG